MKTIPILLLVILSVAGCNQVNNTKNQQTQSEKPLNIILLIGDGMGLSQVSSAFYYSDNTNFKRFKHIGLINTSSATHKITDSGAGGTAIATGKKTYNKAIGVDIDSLPVQNLVEILSKSGYATGFVVTCQVVHATPATFYAHVKSRNLYEDIAIQLVHSDIDFFAGGGTNYFQRRTDGINYLDSLKAYGFTIDTISLDNISNFEHNKKYGFLLDTNYLLPISERKNDYFPKATQKAIDYLSQNEKGFFLVVEGSQIDWGCHDNDADYVISEMLDFDKAIGSALDYAQKDTNTLVIVLADHETGGFTLGAKDTVNMKSDYHTISPTFATTGHSATLIPVFAFGKGADAFEGIYQNADIFHKIIKLTKYNSIKKN